jgi:rod shape-determining protein MreC
VAVYRRPARQRFVLLVVTLLSVTIITVDQRGTSSGPIHAVRSTVRDALAPVQSATDRALAPLGDLFGGVTNYGDLKAENARLRRQLEEARGTAAQSETVQRELKDLTDLQSLPFAGDIPSVAARVTSTSPSNFELTVEIDKGTSAGVAKGMPVVSGQGLVGRVVEASKRRAVVLLMTSPNSAVGVRLSKSGDVGVAQGAGDGEPLPVSNIDPATKTQPGEIVVTSGLQQAIFPPGVPVGKVKTARLRAGGLEQLVTIEPLVDLRRLDFLKVLQWSPQ